MSEASKRSRANPLNAQKSTGPKTAAGKRRASANAVVHGVLSAHLLVDGEDAAAYQALFDALVADLRPAGALELLHVERIAVAIWRQRRLIRVEGAAVRFRQTAEDTRQMLNDALGVGESVRFKEAALAPLTNDELRHAGLLTAILEEFAQLIPFPESIDDLFERALIYRGFWLNKATGSGANEWDWVCQRLGLSEDQIGQADLKAS